MDLFWDEYSGATFSSDLSSEEFSLQGLQTTKGMQNFSSGSYSELRLNAELRRKAAHYVMTVHLPALMISMISCVSLWIPKVQAGARLAIGTCFTCYYCETLNTIDFDFLVCFLWSNVFSHPNHFFKTVKSHNSFRQKLLQKFRIWKLSQLSFKGERFSRFVEFF